MGDKKSDSKREKSRKKKNRKKNESKVVSKKTTTKKVRKKAVKKKKVNPKGTIAGNFFDTNVKFEKSKSENWTSIIVERDRAVRVLEKYQDVILRHPDVTGVHLGFKRVQVGDQCRYNLVPKDDQTSAACPIFAICIHVRKKGKDIKDCHWPLPSHFEGISTDIVESEFVNSLGIEPQETKTQPVDEMRGGVAIGVKGESNGFGTVGFVVSHGGRARYLTNQHVVGGIGSQVVQPPGSDRVIGETDLVDLALDAALIRPNGKLPPKVIDLITGAGLTGIDISAESIVKGSLEIPDINKPIFVVGAETGKQVGHVESLSATVHVNGQGTFAGQILVDSDDDKPITGKGNSGGILLFPRKSNYEVVGLVHAQSNNGLRAIATPICKIIDRFGIVVS